MLQLNQDDDKLDGGQVLCRALKQQRVKHIYGVVGIPVVEVAIHAQNEGIEFYAFRNEQPASYAAGIYGYMHGEPGICLTVGGPGLVHGMAGLANAWSNCWPMVLIAGNAPTEQEQMGAFQEAPQLDSVRPYVKYACRPDSIQKIPYIVEKAIRISKSGKPGPVYIELPADLITGTIPKSECPYLPSLTPIPKTLADPNNINQALQLLQSAKRPLIIVGKGMAYSHAENEVREFIKKYNFPFLATPMGKGVVDDNDSHSVAAARSTALGGADVILLLGARLNWILHFGLPPRYAKDVKFIQVDIDPNTIGDNTMNRSICLCGDGKAVMKQLLDTIQQKNMKFNSNNEWKEWLSTLQKKIQKNQQQNEKLMNDEHTPMSYYRAFKDIREFITKDTIVVSEGANSMDIGRGLMLNQLPRHRLDAGTFGTMGVSFGFAIAAATTNRNNGKRVITVDGDSGFGFSAMELETCIRYRLPITFIVINNSGVYSGVDDDGSQVQNPGLEIGPTQLGTKCRYDEMCKSLGGLGYYVEDPKKLKPTIQQAIDDTHSKQLPSVVNVIIETSGQRRPQEHSWLTKSSKL